MKIKNNSGITMISLVITVIVMLILAGAAIVLSTNGNNFFTTADTAVSRYNNKSAELDEAVTNMLTEAGLNE